MKINFQTSCFVAFAPLTGAILLRKTSPNSTRKEAFANAKAMVIIMGILIALIFLLFFYLALIGFSVLVYVFESLGLMRMLKKCGYDKPWLSWIPFANIFAFGKLAEYYDNGKPRKKIGIQLLVLMIAFTAVFFFGYFAVIFTAIFGAPSIDYTAATVQSGVDAYAVNIGLLMFVWFFAILALTVVYYVFYYITLWKILRIFCPEHAVGLLLLCMFVNPSLPFVFFSISKNDPQNLRQNGTPTPPPMYYDPQSGTYQPYFGPQNPPYNQ